MRILRIAAAIAMAALLGACAGRQGGFALSHRAPAANGYGDYLSARLAASEHNLDDAARYFNASLKLDPANPNLLVLAFFYETATGHVDRAAALAERVTAATPEDRAARLTLAVAALKQGDAKEARADLAKSEKGPFTSLTVALIDAWIAAGEHDDAGLASDLKLLHSQSGTDALVSYHEAMIDEYLGRGLAADTAYRHALETGNATPRLVEAYGRFLERAGRKADALALYRKYAGDSALMPVVATGLTRVAAGTKPEAMVRSPAEGVAEALFGIAASLNDEANTDVSILYLRLALYLRPDLDLASILLADRFEGLEKFADAIAVYRSVGRDSPYYKLAGVEIAIDQMRLKRTDEAIATLKAISAAYPGDVDAWTALGDAYRASGRFKEAAAAYDHIIATIAAPSKKDWPVFFARAISRQQSGDWSGAEADLKEALKLSPDEPDVLNYLGYSWVDQGRNLPEALAMLEKARSLKPYDGYIVDSVGWAYYRLGRYADAARTLEDAILLVPGDPTINDHLGDAFWKVGRKLEARFQWDHALAFGAADDEKAEIEKKLKSGLASGDGHS